MRNAKSAERAIPDTNLTNNPCSDSVLDSKLLSDVSEE